MDLTWDHPEFGRFTHDETSWYGKVVVPAFRAFWYDTGYSNARRSDGTHDLSFHVGGEDDAEDEEDIDGEDIEDRAEVPTPAMIALASRVLANQADLVTAVAEALWDDFNGRGPHSGMWWHGQLAQIVEEMAPVGPPRGPSDLLPALLVDSVSIHERLRRFEGPVAVLHFHAVFEFEHGVGVVTDGRRVLATGYSGDF